MARGRMVNTTIAEDAEFNGLSLEAQLIYLRTIPHLDRDGLINGHPSILWGKVAPLLPDLLSTMDAIITEMVNAGLIIRYSQGKTQILFFKGFTKNQIGMRYEREPASILPPPPGYTRITSGLEPTDSGDTPPTPDQLPTESRPTPDDIRQSSGNVPADIRQSSARAAENRIELEYKRTTTTTAPNVVEAKPESEPEPETKSGSGGGGLPEKRNRRGDEEFARLCLKFEMEGFGTLTELLAEEINALLNEYPVDWISDAMAVAVGANKRQTRYVRGVLIRWRADGRNTPGQPSANAQGKQLLTLKRWCLDRYNIDNPKLVADVPESRIYAEYEHYRQQQTH